MKMRNLLSVAMGVGVCWAVFGQGAERSAVTTSAPDYRPPFDKSDYRGTMGVQLNPWFPLNKAPHHTLGGPNLPWKHYDGADLWAQGMRDLLPYGIKSWVPEINEPVAWTGVWKDLYRQSQSNDIPVKVGMFFGFYSADDETSVKEMKRVFAALGEDLKTNPHTLRAGGYPVMVCYNSRKKRTPAEWGAYFAKLDAAVGRNIYLLDGAGMAHKASQLAKDPNDPAEVDRVFEKLLRESLPYWDGISSYANGFRVPCHIIRKVMKDYPQKLYEGQIHQTYTCHFQMGGTEVDLSRNWRESIEECLASDPDSVLLTNLFDHYENSLVLPCYDREDFLLRYLECRTAAWRKATFRRLTYPELIVTGCQSVWLGRQDLEFEVIGLPIDHAKGDVTLHLEVCDTAGRVLYTFPARAMKLDAIRVERFRVPSVDFAKERGVVPRLRYDWAGGKRAMNYGPMTLLDPSMRPYRLYWARSTKNELQVGGKNAWAMDGVGPGGTHIPRALGRTQFSCALAAVYQGDAKRIGNRFSRIRRDYTEIYSRDESGKDFRTSLTLPMPVCGPSLHWYTIEMENAFSRKFQTLPIWETDGTVTGTVKVPLWLKDGTIVEKEIEKVRVPYWHYKMTDDYGNLLVDGSGWDHNGSIRGAGFGGGHLGYTGYNHYHNGTIGMPKPGVKGLFRKEKDGTGYLAFNGSNDYVMVMGGTAFPGAFTYELKVRPAELGREMGLIGTCNHQLHLDLLADGRLRVSRGTPEEAAGGRKVLPRTLDAFESDVKLAVGAWARLAVVYDLRTLSLYVDGRLAGSVAAQPHEGHEWLNFVVLGAKNKWVWTPVAHFRGDIGETRITGRNLSPAEFCKASQSGLTH